MKFRDETEVMLARKFGFLPSISIDDDDPDAFAFQLMEDRIAAEQEQRAGLVRAEQDYLSGRW